MVRVHQPSAELSGVVTVIHVTDECRLSIQEAQAMAV
jgi:hypothetical protein